MNIPSARLTDPRLPDAPTRAELRLWLGLGVAVLAAAGLAWQGGLPGSLGAGLAAGLGVLATLRLAPGGGRAGSHPGEKPEKPEAPVTGRVGAEVMVSQVVPVWSRQLEATRDSVNDGLGVLLNSFSEMSGALTSLSDTLMASGPAAAPGSIGAAIDAQSPALSALLAPSERAFRQRDEAVAVLADCAESLGELQHQAKQAREISRHTRLVAFNASIEAQRSRQGSLQGQGSQAVANELRELSDRMATAGETIDRLVLKLGTQVAGARRHGEIHDTTPDELRLELDSRAREALQLMLGSLGVALQGSPAMRELSAALQQRLDDTYVNFQFGDRVSQMMSIVANDMLDFARWVASHPQATQNDAAQWLEALEASYTMDEQRAQHHGNVHVDRGSEIEFF